MSQRVRFVGLLLVASVSPLAYGAAAIQDIGNAPASAGGGAVSVPLTPAPTSGAAPSSLSLQERVQRLERVVGNQALVDMLRRLDELQLEVQTLRGQVEELNNSVEGIKSRQRDIYLDIDRRVQQMESRGVQAGGGAAAVDASVVGATSGEGGGDAAGARTAYEKAFGVLREGNYEQAITEFEGFVANYPRSDYANNAQYWLGEANYVTRRFERAIQEFKKLIQNYPDSSKVPDAYLKLGFTYYEMGKWAEARQALTEVKTRYGSSAAARLASERLTRMAQEGH